MEFFVFNLLIYKCFWDFYKGVDTVGKTLAIHSGRKLEHKRLTKESTMKRWTQTLIIAILATSALACGQDDGTSVEPVTMERSQAETYSAALVSEDDIALDFEASATPNALAGQLALTAGLTLDAVVGTNTFLYSHLAIMRIVTSLAPTEVRSNSVIWEGDDDGILVRIEVERSETPRGVRFDYTVAMGEDDASGLLPIVDGHVVRIDTRPAQIGKQGFGIIRFNLSNYGMVKEQADVAGMTRVAFRRIGKVRQVHVRSVGVITPERPDFPAAAEYAYTQLPDGGGSLAWYSKSDVSNDGLPLENVAVHTRWRQDYSGIGHATIFGGSLEVDYWNVGECWGPNLVKGYEKIEMPNMTRETGDPVSCLNLPETLEIPEHRSELQDEDPAIPTAHPAEES